MKHTRRQFLQFSALAAAGVVLAACQPTTAPTTAPSTGGEGEGSTQTTFKGNVELWGQTYTPTESMEWSQDNPLPHNMIQVLADEYHEKNPDATVTINSIESVKAAAIALLADRGVDAMQALNAGTLDEIIDAELVDDDGDGRHFLRSVVPGLARDANRASLCVAPGTSE